MASIEERKNKNGTVTYRVCWTQGGRGGSRESEPFNSGEWKQADKLAERYATLVDVCGQTRPTDDMLRAAGLGALVVAPAAADRGGAARVTVADMVARYVEDLCSQLRGPERRTTDTYRSYLRLYVEPRALGNRDVADPGLTFVDIEAWMAELARTVAPGGKKPLGTNSIVKVYTSLMAPAFDWAMSPRANLRSGVDPCAHVTIPGKVPAPRRDRLHTPDEYATFVAAAYEIDPNWADMVATVAVTGIRDGEYRQLRPVHADRARRLLRVEERHTGGRVELGTKNGQYREVPVPRHVWDACVAPRLDTGLEHIFTGPNGTRWAYSTEADRWSGLRELLARKLPRHLTPHSLRAGYVTWLRSQHINDAKIRAVVGHTGKGVTDLYDELTEPDREHIRKLVTPLIPAARLRAIHTRRS